MSQTDFKRITVSGITYRRLKRLGLAGDSFNDVIDQLVQHAETCDNYKQRMITV